MNASCYLCGSDRARTAFVEDGVPLRRCLACAHVYSGWPQDQHYDGYWKNGVSGADLDFWDGAHRLVYEDFVRRFLPASPGTLVDVGCGLGFFLGTVRRHRPGWSLRGYELSEFAVGWAQEHNDLRGIVQRCPVEESDLPPGSVDVVTMWDVIEHLPRPQALLRRLAGLLKPGGFVFVQTPNWPVQYARARTTVLLDRGVVPGKRYLYAKDHVNQFSRRSLTRLAVETGFCPPTFDVLPPVLTVGGRQTAPRKLAKVGLYRTSQLVWQATGGRVLVNPTLFAFLRKQPPAGAHPPPAAEPLSSGEGRGTSPR